MYPEVSKIYNELKNLPVVHTALDANTLKVRDSTYVKAELARATVKLAEITPNIKGAKGKTEDLLKSLNAAGVKDKFFDILVAKYDSGEGTDTTGTVACAPLLRNVETGTFIF